MPATAWQGILALYHIATGTSQTPISALSTGGTRVLSLTTGMFLGTALLAALINIDLEKRTRWRLGHGLFAGDRVAGILLAFGRTTFLALAVVLVFLAWKLPDARRTALRAWRWWVPGLIAGMAAVAVLAPDGHPGRRSRQGEPADRPERPLAAGRHPCGARRHAQR